MTDKISPALTPHEWKERRITWATNGRNASAELYSEPLQGMHGVLFVNPGMDLTKDVCSAIPRDRHHAIAALCLHQQPFGFSREDVEFLRDVVTAIANPLAMDIRYGVDDEEHMTRLADKIESLLPPENAP